jgi:hypothetical protein
VVIPCLAVLVSATEGMEPGSEGSRLRLSERPFQTQPGGNLRKFLRRLSQFPLSFLAESRWVPAPSVMAQSSLPGSWGDND